MRRSADWVPLAAVAGLLLLTRLPLLGPGYGSDDDAWRNVVAAWHGLQLGRYAPSRPPGFPGFELPLMLLVRGGPLVCNLFAALAGLASAACVLVAARRAGHRAPGLLALGFALAPPLWVTATQTMDYALALAFLTASWAALLSRRAALAGLLLALAAGTRLTLAGLALPFGAWLAWRGGGRGPALRFAAAFALPLLAIEWPVQSLPETDAQGTGFLYHAARQHLTLATAPAAVRSALTWSLGRLGVVALAIGLVAVRLRRGRVSVPRAAAADAWLEATVVAGIAGAWALIPLDPAYLVPALPFAFSLAARALTPAWLAIVLLAGASEAVVTVLPPARLAPGRIALERAERRAQLDRTRAWLAERPAEPTVFVVGRAELQRLVVLGEGFERRDPAWAAFTGPGVALWDGRRALGFAATLTPAQRDSLVRAGVTLRD